MMGTVIVVGLVFTVFGVLFAGVGIGMRQSQGASTPPPRAPPGSSPTSARARPGRQSSGLIWVPVVRFTTADGREVEAETGGGTNLKRHQPGQPIDVVYDPANPSDVRVPGVGRRVHPRRVDRPRDRLRGDRPGDHRDRRRRRLMGYTLRAPRATALLPLIAVPVLLFAGSLLGLPSFPLFFIIAFGLIVLYQSWQRSLVLQVDADGVKLGRGVRYDYGDQRTMITAVPWSSIRDVVVISPGPIGGEGGTEVGVRLRPGAPLPQGARAMVSDPRNPDAVQPDMCTGVPGRFDRKRLAEAVAANGARVVEINRG